MMPFFLVFDMGLDLAAAHFNLGAAAALNALEVSLFLDESDSALNTDGLFS